MAWTENGPVSTPPTAIVGVAALVIAAAALAGLGFGFKTSWRGGVHHAAGAIDTEASGAVMAQPIVELPQPPPPAPAANAVAETNSAKEIAESDDIAEKTAAAQAVQSKPAQSTSDIDDILTSPTEKPQPPAKPSADETPPSPPSDVPF